VPARIRIAVAVLIVAAGTIHWAAHRRPDDWITWAESRANSTGRRAWMNEAAEYMRARYRPGTGILSSGGDDFFGIYRVAGIPLRETFSVDNGLPWIATMQRPELYLWEQWAVVRQGDEARAALELANERGLHYRLEKTIVETDEPVVEIYRRR
jgi:hypothetical protein